MPRSALLSMRATTRPPLTEDRDAHVKAVTSSPLTQNGYLLLLLLCTQSGICHICGRSANINKFKSANLWICDLRNLFADHPPLNYLWNKSVARTLEWKLLGSYYCVIIFPNTVVRLLLNSKGPYLFNVTQQDTASFLHAHQKRMEVLFNVTQQDTANFLHAHQKRVEV